MSVTKPFKRTIRPFTNDRYSPDSYVYHTAYAQSPEQYIRAFLLLQKDLLSLFEYIEPSDKNLQTYSYRVHQLILRTCVEFEANCKAILKENDYVNPKKTMEYWNIIDYEKINATHHLSSYEVVFPIWNGTKKTRKPFQDWANNQQLSWYNAYNQTKHDRHTNFELATLDALLDAITGLLVILASQFHDNDFVPGKSYLLLESSKSGIGDYLEIVYPNDWTEDEKYNFTGQDWQQLKNEIDPFQKHNY